MMMCNIKFADSRFSPIGIPIGQPLAEVLTVQNSPVLFGCRTGICGTCVIGVIGNVEDPAQDELEILELYAVGNPKARLACQLQVRGDVVMTSIVL
jgi:ferredoxin